MYCCFYKYFYYLRRACKSVYYIRFLKVMISLSFIFNTFRMLYTGFYATYDNAFLLSSHFFIWLNMNLSSFLLRYQMRSIRVRAVWMYVYSIMSEKICFVFISCAAVYNNNMSRNLFNSIFFFFSLYRQNKSSRVQKKRRKEKMVNCW